MWKNGGECWSRKATLRTQISLSRVISTLRSGDYSSIADAMNMSRCLLPRLLPLDHSVIIIHCSYTKLCNLYKVRPAPTSIHLKYLYGICLLLSFTRAPRQPHSRLPHLHLSSSARSARSSRLLPFASFSLVCGYISNPKAPTPAFTRNGLPLKRPLVPTVQKSRSNSSFLSLQK
jgi:hypothetical protein